MTRRPSHGLTLIEALVAVLIFALVAGTLLQVIGQTARSASLLDNDAVSSETIDTQPPRSMTQRPTPAWLLRLRRLLEDDLAMANGKAHLIEGAIAVQTLSAIDAGGERVHEPVSVTWQILSLKSPRQETGLERYTPRASALVRIQRAIPTADHPEEHPLDRDDLAAIGIERFEELASSAGDAETGGETTRIHLHGPAIDAWLGRPLLLLGPPITTPDAERAP